MGAVERGNKAPADARRPRGFFQSEQAAAAANPVLGNEDETASAEISAPQRPEEVIAYDPADDERLVKVRPRQTVARMRFGNRWYSFVANKPVMVPACVARHLEEKLIV